MLPLLSLNLSPTNVNTDSFWNELPSEIVVNVLAQHNSSDLELCETAFNWLSTSKKSDVEKYDVLKAILSGVVGRDAVEYVLGPALEQGLTLLETSRFVCFVQNVIESTNATNVQDSADGIVQPEKSSPLHDAYMRLACRILESRMGVLSAEWRQDEAEPIEPEFAFKLLFFSFHKAETEFENDSKDAMTWIFDLASINAAIDMLRWILGNNPKYVIWESVALGAVYRANLQVLKWTDETIRAQTTNSDSQTLVGEQVDYNAHLASAMRSLQLRQLQLKSRRGKRREEMELIIAKLNKIILWLTGKIKASK